MLTIDILNCWKIGIAQNLGHRAADGRCITDSGDSDDLPVNREVGMDREVAECRDSAPVDYGMPSPHLRIETGRCFSDLGESLENRSSQDMVVEELHA
jgi:hypothetical protein